MPIDPAQIEAVSRAYCLALGLDPDKHVVDYRSIYCMYSGIQWQAYSSLARERLAMDAAIAAVKGEK